MRYLILFLFASFLYAYSFEVPKNNWEEVYKKTGSKDTIKSLFEITDDFKEVYFEGETLILVPKPVLKKLVITGNKSYWDTEIKAATGLREGSIVDIESLDNVPLRIRQFYYDNGFFGVKVDIDYKQEDNNLYVEINIQEGKKSKLKEINFLTDQSISNVDIETFKKVMGLKYGKTLKFTDIQNAIEKLQKYLLSIGYYDSYVELSNITSEENGLTKIDISINFGTKYIIRFNGNNFIGEDILKGVLTFADEGFNYYQLGQSLQNIIKLYQNSGFLDIALYFDLQESDEKFEEMYPVFTIVNINIEEGKRYKVKNTQIISDIEEVKEEITKIIQNESYYNKAKLESFLKDYVNSLKEKGFLTAYYDLEETVKEENNIDLNIKIFKNEKYVLKQISVEGFNFDKKKLKIKLPRIYNPFEVLDIQKDLQKELINNGYYDGQVLLDVLMEKDGDTIQAKAVYNVITGQRYKNGFIFVYGSKHLNPTVVINQFPKEGSFFRNDKVESGLDRLYSSRLFESVNLYILEDRENKLINTAILLQDDKRGLFQGSIGYSTDQLFKASVLAVFKNLFKYGFEISTYVERSNFQTSYKASFGNRLLPKNLSSFVSAYSSEQYRRYFDLRQTGYEISLEKKNNLWVTTSLTFSKYDTKLINTSIPFQQNSYGLNKVSLNLTDDHRDIKVDTKSGYIFSAKIDYLFGFRNFTRTELNGRYYKNLFDRFIISPKISVGHMFKSIENIPVSERYYIGGISSLRGFGLEEVAGKDKIGGNSFFLVNGDFRFLVYPKYNLYFLMFLDMGNVFKDNDELKRFYLRKSAGAGVYVPTPVGSLIFDVAKKLDKKPGEESFRIELSIGANF